ncbi:MAG: Wzz/FepE/Etk N-terminal domain-containing protein, partial [bacterium]
MELRDYWRIFWKRKAIIGLLTIIAALLGLFINFQILDVVYSAKAQILVEQPPRILMLTEKSTSASPRLSVETQMKLIKSLRVAKAAAKMLDKSGDDEENEKLGANLRNQIKVTNVEETGIIEVIHESSNPKYCAEVANAFANAFEDISKKISKESVEEATRFIEEQLEIADSQLKDAERKIFEFNAENGVISLDDEALQRNSAIADLEIQRME